ncbi:MAG: gamma-glutamylcyclotransferase family protein [Pseudomonadota bacterium]
MLHYLAYGSNLHPLRLKERVPSAKLVGTVALDGYRLAFHKRSIDASGKCNLLTSAGPSHRAYGAIFRIDEKHKNDLDRHERVGKGYRHAHLHLRSNNESHSCFCYVADPNYVDDALLPYDWYTRLVVLGAEYLGMPAAYLDRIKRLETIPDPDAKRKAQNEELIRRIMAVNTGGFIR